jgi:hypothetical protein
MHFVSVVFFILIGLQMGVVAELDASSCSLLRTAASLTNIIPEIAQLAMRYYRVSSSSEQHHRQKRFLFTDGASKDGSAPKGSVLEQMVATAFKDVNFTRVALLILNNNETMAKIRQNVDGDAILRAAMREIDYEKLGSSLWYSAEAEFDLEYIIASFVNFTHIDSIYEQVVINGTLPDSLIKSLHPDLNVKAVQKMFNSLKNITHRFASTVNSSEQLESYLYNVTQQHILTPMGKIIQQVKSENPTTLDELVEIILDNANKVVMVKERFFFKMKIILWLILGTILINQETYNNKEIENQSSNNYNRSIGRSNK